MFKSIISGDDNNVCLLKIELIDLGSFNADCSLQISDLIVGGKNLTIVKFYNFLNIYYTILEFENTFYEKTHNSLIISLIDFGQNDYLCTLKKK